MVEPGTDQPSGPSAAGRGGSRRRWGAVLAACLAVAVGTPVAWVVSRPDALAGEGLDAALPAPAASSAPAAASPTPAPAPSSTQGDPSRLPLLAARDAGPATSSQQVRDAAPPVELRIPAIDVVAPVDALGVDAEGAMALPEDVRRTAWYRWGAVPGSGSGSAVVAGHVASATDGRGVLGDLAEVGPGDRVEVVTAAGDVLGYEVVTREAVVKDSLPVGDLFADDGPERLVLVTCGGPYLQDVGSHRDNVVVVAQPR